MEDFLLKKMFEIERWEKAIDVGVGKRINKGELRKLTSPEVRLSVYNELKNGNLKVLPPHQALIPKDNGEFRTVYVNENLDRVLLSIINDMLFELCPEMVHKQCKSYQLGIGCGKVVQEASRELCKIKSNTVGLKADLTKYFDSVPRKFILDVFERLENKFGKSKVIDYVRDYYNQDLCFDTNNELISHYQSLKQGCAVASFLADVMLYDIDDYFTKNSKYYCRYSDDLLIIGEDTDKNYKLLEEMLNKMDLTLNPKKVEVLKKDKFFKFLGFSIRGSEISLSKSRIKSFQKEIEHLTVKDRKNTLTKAINKVNRYLYKGEYSWATSVLPIINIKEDIEELNLFVMDSLRAVSTKKVKIGGLGYEPNKKVGVITRGRGKNVTSNRQKTDKLLENFKTLTCMRNALLTSRELFNALTNQM